MISEAGLYGIATVVYVIAFVGLIVWLRFIPETLRRYCYPLVGVVGLAVAMGAAELLGVGQVGSGDAAISVPSLLEGIVAYAVAFAVCGWLADVDRRLLGVLVAIPTLQVISYHVAASSGGVLALGSGLFVIVGHGIMTYLFLGPVWRSAQSVPERQRLLHWKCRNLLLFLIGVLIAYAITALVVDLGAFTGTTLVIYIDLLIRVGIAGFLFANIGALEEAAADAAADSPPRQAVSLGD